MSDGSRVCRISGRYENIHTQFPGARFHENWGKYVLPIGKSMVGIIEAIQLLYGREDCR